MCSSFTRKNLARDLHSNTEPAGIAEKYSHGYIHSSGQAAYEGCFAGIR